MATWERPRHARRFARNGAQVALGLFLTACGGHHGGGTATSDLSIAGISGAFGASGLCTTSTGPGTPRTVTRSFVDLDGDLNGGHVQLGATFATASTATPTAIPVAFPIPSSIVKVSGTTSGTVTFGACARFGVNSSLIEQVDLGGRSRTHVKSADPYNSPAGWSTGSVTRGRRWLRFVSDTRPVAVAG